MMRRFPTLNSARHPLRSATSSTGPPHGCSTAGARWENPPTLRQGTESFEKSRGSKHEVAEVAEGDEQKAAKEVRSPEFSTNSAQHIQPLGKPLRSLRPPVQFSANSPFITFLSFATFCSNL